MTNRERGTRAAREADVALCTDGRLGLEPADWASPLSDSSAMPAYAANDPASSEPRLRATKRWARFLLQHGAPDAAHTLFTQVVDQDAGRALAFTAMAQTGLAQVALAKDDPGAAVQAAAEAMQRWASVRGFRDVRMGAYVERVQAQALLADGQRDAARQAAQDALAQSLCYDAPGAASIAEARALGARAS